MVSDQPYKTGPLDRIERAARRSQGARGSARVDQTASVVSTSQGVPNSPPPPSQRTRDDPNPLSPLATIFHPSASQGASAADSALAGITQRGTSKKSEPSLAGVRSSSTSATPSVKSGDSSHYRTPHTTDTIPPIPTVVGPSTTSGLNPSPGFDSDKRVLTALVAQLVAESTQNITQTLTLYFDQRLQAQEFAAQASQAAFEKKLLEKVDRIEDDQAFFRGEVQAQKKSIGDLRVSVDKVTTEVTKLAEQVKAQHELKVDVTDHVTPEDLDQVWNQLNALQNAVFPEVNPSPLSAVDPQESLSFEPPRENSLQSTSWIENPAFQPGSLSSSPAFHSALSGSTPASSSGYQSSITFDPIPPLHRATPQPTGSSHQHAVPPAAPSRERNLPRISEVDHGGHIPFNMGIHAGARRVPLAQLPPGPPSAPPASEYHSPSHPSEGASHHHSHAKAPPPAYVPAHVPSDSRRPPPVQLHLPPSSWIENSLSSSSLPQSPHTPHSALSHSPSPSTSEYQSPVTHNPNPHHVLPQAADHVQHLLVVPSVPNRERDLPRVTEIDHGGSVVPLRVSRSHFGAQGMCNKMPLPTSPLPAPDHSPSPQSSDEGVSHLPYSCAIASPPTPLAGHHPSRSHRSAPISSSSQSLQLPTCHLPPISRHDSSHAPSTSGRSDGPDVPVVLVVGGHYMPPQPAVLTQPFAPRPSGATGAVGPPSTSQSSRTPCVGTSPCSQQGPPLHPGGDGGAMPLEARPVPGLVKWINGHLKSLRSHNRGAVDPPVRAPDEHVALRGTDDPPQRGHQAAAERGAGGSSNKGRRTRPPVKNNRAKDVKWEWTAERASAWRDLKDALCCPDNALRHPDRNVRYVLHTDWSQKGLSAVLGQVDPKTGTEYLIACTSRSCNVHEARYGSYKGEMMAAVWGVRTFRCYLLGAPHPFILLTDHKGLSWLMSNKELEGQYARWSVMLSEFNFIIEYKPGVKHIIADVPSRFPRSTTADVTGTRESYHQFVSTQQLLSHSEHGLDCLADCLASAPSDFDAYCFNHVADFLNARIDCTQDYLDDEDCLISLLIDYSHMGNTIQADDDVSVSHSVLFTPSSELLLHTAASHLLRDSQHHAIDIHDLSSMDVSISAYAHSVDLAFVSTTQHELQLKAARQVELCHSSLTLRISNSSELPLRLATSPFGDVVHSICTAPVPDCCISAIHSDGVRVIELFGGMVSGLDCLLRNGVKILQYSYCDLSHQARAVAHHRLTQLTVQYPDQLPLKVWSSAFTALPQDVYSITEEHLSFAGA
ncbi:hypothetical protein CEUSTIGMA_g13768.t1, partial [Chlamydomonas eustigma]